MLSAITSTLLLSSKPRFLSKQSFCVAPSTCPKSFLSPTSPPLKPLLLKCSNNSEEKERSNDLKDALSGIVGKQVEELLNREENKDLLDGLEKASQRVERAKRELAEIERQELEAQLLRNYINQLESRASEIAECQQEISQARAMVEEAEQSLSLNEDNVVDGDAFSSEDGEGIAIDKERLESIKAALISALVGTLAGLPISFTQVSGSTQLLLPLSVTFISCALFGVTFRYAVRRDLDNFQLKTGTSAAFGFVKGLGTLGGGPPLELDPESFLSHAVDGAVYVSQNLIIFLFAAIGLDFCIKMRLLSPFPIKRSAPKTNTRYMEGNSSQISGFLTLDSLAPSGHWIACERVPSLVELIRPPLCTM
ncbi:uncharacterized protein LOC111291114 isoform X2 [Durio zibethinus]|uniref:Uncharacterized protein LOC111291114 isoform X2 n=1 Tax=Durio zibethinus TaxID=66656 RepID=A0A6P5YD75_DURZI|nr:uncharacterized protein LOC111291114 isoform X2 [Durio zibethinus]